MEVVGCAVVGCCDVGKGDGKGDGNGVGLALGGPVVTVTRSVGLDEVGCVVVGA